MAESTNLDSLLTPGNADNFFDGINPGHCKLNGTYSHGQAWFFSELSRLVYRQDPQESGLAQRGPLRAEFMQRAGLNEKLFIRQGSTQCALVERSGDEHALIVVFRGTQNLQNWITNLNTAPVANPAGGKIHRGFRDALDAVWDDVSAELKNLRQPLYFAGHSLGGALAVAAAARSEVRPQAVFTFGAPRVGSSEYNQLLHGIPIHRVVNAGDMVPAAPPSQFGFDHAGTLHYLRGRKEYVENPSHTLLYRDRIGAALDLADLGRQFTSMAPHRMLYMHAPVNYTSALKVLI